MDENVQAVEGAAEDQGRADSLAHLQTLAGGPEGGPGGPGPGVSEGVPIDPVQEAREVIAFGVALFVPLYPSLEGVYTEAVQDRLAAVSVPMMQKYGLSMGGLFERWGAEINFALVAVPLARETVKAVRADNAARAAAAEAGEGGDGEDR